MALYSLNGKKPDKLPNRIRLSNGLTRTKSSTFTDEEIADAGYILANDIPDPPETKFYQLEWNGSDWSYRTTPNENETINKWNDVKAERDVLLKEADIKTMMAFEKGVSDPYVDPYKAALRDITKNNTDPWNIEWPFYGEVIEQED